jgi:glycosyltransferase involved in cell wall biosynthesis
MDLNIVWVNPVFLHYRVPVYALLNKMTGGRFALVYSRERVPEDVQREVEEELGENAYPLGAEKVLRLVPWTTGYANKGLEIWHPPELKKVLRSLSPNVLILEGFGRWTPWALSATAGTGIRRVLFYERTKHTERNAQSFRRWYRRQLVRFFHAFVCNGVLSREYLIEMGADAGRIMTGGMAADRRRLRSSDNGTFRSRVDDLPRPIFLTVGSLIELKGIRQLLDAWSYYKAHGGEGGLVFVGQGALIGLVRQAERTPSLRVRVFDGIPHGGMGSVYRACDVGVSASIEDNWSLVVPEAMACGLPIACSMYNGCWPELVQEGINGTVFNPLNRDDIVRALSLFAERRDSLAEMGQRSMNIEGAYGPAHAAGAVFRACEMALSGRKESERV